MCIINVKDCEDSTIYTTMFCFFPSQIDLSFVCVCVLDVDGFRSYDHKTASLKKTWGRRNVDDMSLGPLLCSAWGGLIVRFTAEF